MQQIPVTGQFNDCWECSGDTARVGWYYCVCSALPRSAPCDGEGSKGNEPSSQRRQQGPGLWTALLQPEHLQSQWLGDSLNLGPSCTSASGHRALWRLGSLVLPLSFSGSNVIWSDTKEDLLLEPLDWNVLLKFFSNDGMKWLQPEGGKPVVRRGPFGINVFPLNKNFKYHVVHSVCVYPLWPFVGRGEGSVQ